MQDDPQNGTLQSGTMQIGEDAKEDDYDATITTRGGWELGSYLFIGNGLQVVGLQTVPADRAAFLVQLTTVMVPLLSALTAGTLSAVPLPTWLACIVAFAGVVVMGADDAGSESIGSFDVGQLSISQGDFLIVLAAVAYSLHVVRLGAYAPRTTPLKLAASKATTEAILSVTLVVALAFIGTTHIPSPEFVSQTGNSVSEYFQTMSGERTAHWACQLAPSFGRAGSHAPTQYTRRASVKVASTRPIPTSFIRPSHSSRRCLHTFCWERRWECMDLRERS